VPDLAAEPAATARRQAGEWLHGLYEGPDQWNPLRPDRVGEALIARVLRERENGGSGLLGAVLDLASDAQVERALEVLVRLAADPTASVIAEVLGGRYSGLVRRCVQQARGAPGRPGRAGLLDSLTRAHLALLTDSRVSALPLAAQAQVSASADVLADLAREYGRAREALAIYEGAMAIDQRKTELEPGNTTYRRDLSVSYNKLADLARAAGRSADAEALYRQSLTVAQELTELEPGNTTYRRDLSVSYERLGKIAAESGQAEEAQRCLTIALDVRRGLHRQEPERVDLAEELGVTLYLFAGAAGDQAGARQEIVDVLVPFERAGTITRKGISLLGWARQPPGE
jgi:tetratricopeptide (TPR) repeat protein